LRSLLVVVLVLVCAAPAWGHVTVIPAVARPGDTVELSFRVQNERDDVATTGLKLFLPKGVPARITGRPGWSHEDEGNGEISFSPDTPEAVIPPGRTQDFKVTLGPLPQADRIVIKALQTYADGEVVRWIQDTGEDDERPAAILDLSGSGNNGDSGSTTLIIVVIAVPLLALTLVGVLVTRRRRRDI
jgi:uncharacterized protein YcnI